MGQAFLLLYCPMFVLPLFHHWSELYFASNQSTFPGSSNERNIIQFDGFHLWMWNIVDELEKELPVKRIDNCE